MGLGVKGGVHKVEQLNFEVSGINLEMTGFIDLSALALVAGYQMNASGMTPMGVQVLGAILNKCISTALLTIRGEVTRVFNQFPFDH